MAEQVMIGPGQSSKPQMAVILLPGGLILLVLELLTFIVMIPKILPDNSANRPAASEAGFSALS